MTQLQQNRKMQIFRPIMIGTYSLTGSTATWLLKEKLLEKNWDHVNIFEAFLLTACIGNGKNLRKFQVEKGFMTFCS